MEFYEKLQQLRKRNHMTQEQLAERLFVSRTAVSKWESGRGYPNLESLKCISRLFSVSIDELLSNDELIELAETENRSNINQVTDLAFSALDIGTIMFLFVPLFGQQDIETVRAVTLMDYTGVSELLRSLYFGVLITVSVVGLLKILFELTACDKSFSFYKPLSLALYAIAILLFALSRQPYITAVLFVLFLVKMVYIGLPIL